MSPHRVNIINALQLIGSSEAQDGYARKVPYINVATELVNQWFDDFYHPGDEQFDGEFSATELASLKEFNEFFDVRVPQLPDTLEELSRTEAWEEVMASARKVLVELGWQNVVARYES